MRCVHAAILITLGAIAATASVAAANPDELHYNALDLAAGKIIVRRDAPLPAGSTVDLVLNADCPMTIASNEVTITRPTPPDFRCRAIFGARHPDDVRFTLGHPGGSTSVTVLFDAGIRDAVTAYLDVTPADTKIDLRNDKLYGMLAFHSAVDGRWQPLEIKGGKGTLAAAHVRISPGTKLYFRPNYSDDVLAIDWMPRPEPEKVMVSDLGCTAARYRTAGYDWIAVLSAHNPTSALTVFKHPSRPNEAAAHAMAIEPNSFGLVVVFHADSLVATFDSGVPQLTQPGFVAPVGQSGATPGPGVVETRAAPPPRFVCTTHEVGPQAPGGHQVTIQLRQPGSATDTAKNVVSERKLDLLVLKRYVGAFRTGVAVIGLAPDREFESRTAPGSTQPEIVQTELTPLELVVGYSIFRSSLGGPGRSYFQRDGEARQDDRLGLYLGFGALSLAGGTNVDFLKSVHLGVEVEVGPHLAIALTGVLRRVDRLGFGADVGTPAGADVPTEKRYVPGVGLVVNISPEFFKFANKPPGT